MEYDVSTCPNAEKLHFEQMVINEHIRSPNIKEDINCILNAIKKIVDI